MRLYYLKSTHKHWAMYQFYSTSSIDKIDWLYFLCDSSIWLCDITTAVNRPFNSILNNLQLRLHPVLQLATNAYLSVLYSNCLCSIFDYRAITLASYLPGLWALSFAAYWLRSLQHAVTAIPPAYIWYFSDINWQFKCKRWGRRRWEITARQ